MPGIAGYGATADQSCIRCGGDDNDYPSRCGDADFEADRAEEYKQKGEKDPLPEPQCITQKELDMRKIKSGKPHHALKGRPLQYAHGVPQADPEMMNQLRVRKSTAKHIVISADRLKTILYQWFEAQGQPIPGDVVLRIAAHGHNFEFAEDEENCDELLIEWTENA